MATASESTRRPCVVITYPFPLGTRAAGGSRTTPEVARHLGRLGVDVIIMAVSTNALDRRFPRAPIAESELGYDLDDWLRPDSVEIVRVDQHPVHFQFDPYQVKKALKRILKRRPVDLVLAHYNEAGCLAALLRKHDVRLGFLATWQTYSYLNREYVGLWGKLKTWGERKFTIRPHQAADILFAISRFTRAELVNILGVDETRIVIAPLGVRPTFTEIEHERNAGPIQRFFFFGRMVPNKGIIDALEAFGQVAQRGNRDWNFRMVGQGRHDMALATAERLGIADLVSIEDATDDAGLQRELAAADVALLPSHAESFGLAIAEAQGAGIPVIAYAAGSVPEVVAAGETGWLAPLHDVDALARCIEEAVADPVRTRSMGAAARERVKRLFHWDKTARIIRDGMQSLADKS